jgi:hypothetical protein
MFFYSSEKSDLAGVAIAFHKFNATKCWLKHYDNLLFLQFVANNVRASRTEKHQAAKEMLICERKLKFWARQENYVEAEAQAGALKAKTLWSAP